MEASRVLDSEIPETTEDHGHGHDAGSIGPMMVGAIGVVFGDIGTSPLYSLQETFVGHHPLLVDKIHIFGVVCLIFWTLIIVVTTKYVWLIMRADNKGEGGSLALLALIQRRSGVRRWTAGLVMLGVAATALFFGDAIVTPAISVLSAVEGLSVVNTQFTPFVVPLALVILAGLFMIQARGTATVGKIFGPLMIFYFAVIGALGIYNVSHRPEVLQALNPVWAVRFFAVNPRLAFLALGSVVLSVTGAEALYADMGHFGRRPITYAWYGILGTLVLNYLGQSALLLSNPHAAENPFFLMAPQQLRLPLVLLATVATIIASQAVITGTYSVARQAIQLGLVPRMKITHTSERAAGQIYVPTVNWGLAVMVILLVLGFRSSSNLAAAYGIAVTGTMFITTSMLAVLASRVWNWPHPLVWLVVGTFLVIDGAYLLSTLTKITSGGWFPLLVGAVVFTLLTTWAKGRALLISRMNEATLPIEVFIKSAAASAARVPGTAVFMTSAATGVPHALLHNLKHNKVLHERVVLLTVRIEDVPYVAAEKRLDAADYGSGFYRVVLRYGFMEEVDVPAALSRLKVIGAECRTMETSFFLARQTLLPSSRPGMAIWREKLFAWMLRNAESAMEFFKLPTNRVVELGSQVEI